MQKWLWIILHQRFSSYTTAFLKNVVAFHLKHRRVFFKGGHLFKKGGHLFYYMFMQ
jgi:hypothetical protein